MGFFSNFFRKDKKVNKESNVEFVKNNYIKIINYWSGIIEGSKKLKDGSKFNDNTVYNTKHLEYTKEQIQLSLIQRGMNSKDEKDYEGVKTCYMWTANFNDAVKDKYVNSTQNIMDLVTKYGEKDFDKMIKEIADVPHDEKQSSEFFKAITNDQLAYCKMFDEIINKSKK